MKKHYLFYFSVISGFLLCSTAFGQNETSTDTTSFDEDFYTMDLASMMEAEVYTASKKSETSFDAPLSISSVTYEEIQRAGITSIPEALRLIPGLIVREITNGNYEIHIRGLDGLPPSTALNNANNSITLVMIDNRPVYNYFNGGTFWETLPVDINDVDQIEVVRGASSALYGPNAAAGVINIITKKVEKEGIGVLANAQGGSLTTAVVNSSISYKKNKFSTIVSGNYQTRNRSEELYYSWLQDKKVKAEEVFTYYPGMPLSNLQGQPNANERYPNTSLALQKIGYNAFLNYDINKEKEQSISLTAGGQSSTAQKSFADNLATPLTTVEANSYYVDGRVKLGNFTSMVSNQFGTQNISKGETGFEFDYNTLDAVAEYDIKIKKLTLKPGINYRSATYDDSKYTNIEKKEGFLNGKKDLSNFAGSLRGEFSPIDALKLIAAVRVDQYNYPDKLYTSYQFATSYKLNPKNLVRIVYSRSFRGPTFYDIYNSQSIYVGDFPISENVSLPAYASVVGNQKIELLKIDLIELGYRIKVTESFHIDADVFYQKATNYSQAVGGLQGPSLDFSKLHIPQNISNIPMIAKQTGVTIASNIVINKKIQFKPFVTIQQTQLTGVSRYRDSKAANPVENINVTYDTLSTASPAFFGGFHLNYQITKKLNINLSNYFVSNQTYINVFDNFKDDFGGATNGVVDINGKILVNLSVRYKFTETLNAFVTVKNALNDQSYEFAHTDKTPIMFLVGASFKY